MTGNRRNDKGELLHREAGSRCATDNSKVNLRKCDLVRWRTYIIVICIMTKKARRLQRTRAGAAGDAAGCGSRGDHHYHHAGVARSQLAGNVPAAWRRPYCGVDNACRLLLCRLGQQESWPEGPTHLPAFYGTHLGCSRRTDSSYRVTQFRASSLRRIDMGDSAIAASGSLAGRTAKTGAACPRTERNSQPGRRTVTYRSSLGRTLSAADRSRSFDEP
jgi:hypothetical protein